MRKSPKFSPEVIERAVRRVSTSKAVTFKGERLAVPS